MFNHQFQKLPGGFRDRQTLPGLNSSGHDFLQRDHHPGGRSVVPSGGKWVSLRAERESRLIHIDDQGTLFLPESGICIETWFYQNGRLDLPGHYRPLGQRPRSYYGIETNYSFDGSACHIVLFPIAALVERFVVKTPANEAGHLIGVEYRINGRKDKKLNEIMVLFAVRPLSRDGSMRIRHLEYKQNYLWVNEIPLIYFPESPGHCFFCEREGELWDFIRLREGNTRLCSRKQNCQGLIGYSGLVDELDGVTYFLNYSNKARTFAGGFNSFFRTASEFLWRDRYQRQTGIIDAGILNELLSGTFPHLMTFSQGAGERLSPALIMILNRFGLFNESRALLEKGIHNATLMNRLKNQPIGYWLPFLICDYFCFSRDAEFLNQCRSFLKTIGNWLLFRAGFGLKRDGWKKNVDQDDQMVWFCAALKSMAALAKIMNVMSESAIYQNHYFHFRTLMLRRIQDSFLKTDLFRRQRMGTHDEMQLLSGVYPLNLWEKGSDLSSGLIQKAYQDYNGFPGVNLRFTAALGLVFLWEGLDYGPFLDRLFETGKGTWNWPDIVDMNCQAGIGAFSHDPETLFHVLLMVRNLFVVEDDDVLELFPGFSGRTVWRCPRVMLRKFPTQFGEIAADFWNIGLATEINFYPNFWRKPSLIRMRRRNPFTLTYCDTWVREGHEFWEFGPELRRLRFKLSAVTIPD